ncbi:MAG: XRE family transcriptional regulator [Xanthomonadaceae bacterium]|nr:XRE family transcriptional regulator [Xanthomonadaceae bacterium]
MGFPNEKELAKVRTRLSKKPGFLMLSPNADELEKFRFQICQELLKYASQHELSAVAMAKLLDITKADISRIFNHRITRFSTDKLVRLYSKIHPNYHLKIT